MKMKMQKLKLGYVDVLRNFRGGNDDNGGGPGGGSKGDFGRRIKK